MWGIFNFFIFNDYQFPEAKHIKPLNQKPPFGPWGFLDVKTLRFYLQIRNWTGATGV